MKRFSRLSTVCAALVALTLTGGIVCLTPHAAHAQKGNKRGNRAGGAANNPIVEAFKSVSPTADAQTKFDALFATYEADAKAARAAAPADKKEARKQTEERTMKLRTDVDALLTPDQVTKFHQGIVTIPIMQHLDRELVLTPDEKTKIEPILADYATKTDGMKTKEKRPMMEDAKGKIRAVLTADQQTKLDAMPSIAPGGGGRRGGGAAGTGGVPPVPPVTPAPPVTPPTTP